ncbi:MAG TPA: NAD(P)H-hydrate dehydratase [Nitrososphaeraceae archaeon]|nr:NAD(P)H-hydrate dehydratase [Nitrososphaeraceae archaeon]
MQVPKIVRVSPKLVKDHVVPRLESSKKGDNGTVLVVGGSRIYHGAPLLTSMAALRSGVDLVYTAVPRSNIVAVRSFSPNIIALPLPDDKLTMGSANRLIAIIPKKPNTAAIGMGMSIAEPKALIALIKQLKNGGTKLLLDASSIIPLILKEISGTGTIITPHAGEYKRIFEEDIGVTEKEQISNVQRHAKEYGITLILKGRVDIVSDGERVAINKIHNCAMTVGGTGDVLSGVVAGLLAKLKPFDASILGVYFNGVAGNLAYKRVGLHMLATDLIEDLPNAFKPFDIIKK